MELVTRAQPVGIALRILQLLGGTGDRPVAGASRDSQCACQDRSPNQRSPQFFLQSWRSDAQVQHTGAESGAKYREGHAKELLN
jgi:hypothetical protein